MKKVLIVDDDPSNLKMMSILLKRRGFEVMVFDNPLECPIYSSPTCPCSPVSLCPDIIISDVDMPKVNGLEFVEAVVKKGCKCNHVALVTGQGLDEQKLDKAGRLNVRCFLKPLDLDEFDAWLFRAAM